MPFMEREQSISLWPSSDISQGSSPKLLCSLPGGERFTLWPWACKGLRPEVLETGWFSHTGAEGACALMRLWHLLLQTEGAVCGPAAVPSVSNSGGLKFVCWRLTGGAEGHCLSILCMDPSLAQAEGPALPCGHLQWYPSLGVV